MISKEIIKDLRKIYPVGARVKLLSMEDEQAPPTGTLGTVYGVDDIGSILLSGTMGQYLMFYIGLIGLKRLKNSHLY